MNKIKYPRTLHLPWSEGIGKDDKIIKSLDDFIGKYVVVTEKMDGENTTLYWNGENHARSLDSKNHESRNWIKRFHSERVHLFPENYRVCGENLYAKHSIKYENLKSYFYGFSLWEDEFCFPWDFTVSCFEGLKIHPVDVIWKGIFDEKSIKDLSKKIDTSKIEGFVLRIEDGFYMNDFTKCVAKFVRKGHVNTDKHWMNSKLEKNEILAS